MLFVGALLVLVWGHEDFSEFPGKLEDLQKRIDAWELGGLNKDTTKEQFFVDVLLGQFRVYNIASIKKIQIMSSSIVHFTSVICYYCYQTNIYYNFEWYC